MRGSRDAIALAATFASYRLTVIPALRRELGRWREAARQIPEPILREQALASVTEKASNVEAIGVFATLTPRRGRHAAIRAMAALQVAVDYIDTISERRPGEDEPAGAGADGLQLHRALTAALTPGAPPEDWYANHPRREDVYLSALVSDCQATVSALPSQALLPHARRAAERCGEGQSHTHAAAHGDRAALEGWAVRLPAPAGYRWWELAAGASSSVSAHALIAAAADRDARESWAEPLEAAYFPPIGALTVLLDDLVDRDADAAAGEHNYLAYYADADDAAARLASLAARASAVAAALPRRRRHEAILSGVVAYYLSEVEGGSAFAEPIRQRLLAEIAPTGRPLTALLRRFG